MTEADVSAYATDVPRMQVPYIKANQYIFTAWIYRSRRLWEVCVRPHAAWVLVRRSHESFCTRQKSQMNRNHLAQSLDVGRWKGL